MTLGDDLKKYEVPSDIIPVWYFDTIKEFITYYCPDMHWRNKVLLFEMLCEVERRQKGESRVIEFRRKAV